MRHLATGARTFILPGGRWEVQLLGGLRARHGDAVVTNFGGRFAARLFARLVLEPDTAHGRDTLAAWLWPDDCSLRAGSSSRGVPAEVLKRLTRALHRLNDALALPGGQAAAPVLATVSTLQLNAALFDSDVAAFQRHLERGDTWAARRSFRGPLLPGMQDPWIDDKREELDLQFARVSDDPGVAVRRAAPTDQRLSVRAYATRFFGRSAELQQVLQALPRHRLVVLTGPPGSGKSRLAARACDAVHDFDLLAYTGLVDCQHPEQLLDRVRLALDISADDVQARRMQASQQDPDLVLLELLAAHLQRRRALLLLDNIEHLVGPVAGAMFDLLLAHIPGLHLLVTSRRALQRGDAHEIALAPLPLPPQDADIPTAMANPCVALLFDRARQVSTDFAVHQRNVPAVLALVHLLEGLPLAIELAAAKMRKHTPHALCAELHRSGAVLARRTAAARSIDHHASLDAALALSWRLLADGERRLLVRLTAFRGGWTAEQAQAVWPEAPVRPGLSALQQDSLIFIDAEALGRQRFRMLRSVRDFVLGSARPDRLAQARRLHASHFMAAAVRVAQGEAAFDTAELPNVLAAVSGAVEHGEPEAGADLVLTLDAHWSAAGASADALAAMRQTLQALPRASSHRGRMAGLLARVLVAAGQTVEARAMVEQALQDGQGDAANRAEALLADATVRWLADRDRAGTLRAAEAALDQARALADGARIQARALLLIGAAMLTDAASARRAQGCFAHAQRLFFARNDRAGDLRARAGRNACQLARGEHQAAVRSARAGDALAIRHGDIAAQLQFCSRLSSGLLVLGQDRQAVEVCQRQTRIARTHGLAYHTAYGVWNQCLPLARLGELDRAATLMAYAASDWTARFGPLDAADLQTMSEVRALVEGGLGEQKCASLWRQGERMSEEEALGLACGD